MGGRIIRMPEGDEPKLMYPRVGTIHVGMKNDKGFPQSVDYFIPRGRYSSLFTQAYGEKPDSIQIVFPSDDPSLVCNEYYEYRDMQGSRFAYGDGMNFMVWDKDHYAEFCAEQYPDIMTRISDLFPKKERGWKVQLTMNFIIPKIRGIAGCWTFRTSGNLSSIPQIRTSFDTVLQNNGFVKNVLFDLNVTFAKSQKPNDPSRFPVVSLIPNESEENIKRIKG